jgi:signal transduction histidine kinase
MNQERTEPDSPLAPGWPGLADPLIELTPLPMVEVEGPEHLLRAVNAAFCRLLQKKRTELLGRPFREIVRNGEESIALLDEVYAAGEFATEATGGLAETNPTFWLTALWPGLGGDSRPARVVIRLSKSAPFHADLAATNEALLLSSVHQHELRATAEQSNARLLEAMADLRVTEGALREANHQLMTATLLAERASKAKDDFLAVLSHELRTPLTPVLTIAAALREDQRLPSDVREQLGAIERNVTLEARLIDDLLDLTKISHGKLHLRSEPCAVHDLIELAIQIVRTEAVEKEITLERSFTATPGGLWADPARFQQIVWNLLRNAVKFTPPGGKISIRTSTEKRGETGLWLRIEVTDTGIGIDRADLEHIFLPFDQGHHAGAHRFGGAGLGLAIVRSVVRMHGGLITAESPGLNRGATFVVELPGVMAAPPGFPAALPFPPAAPGREQPKPTLRLLLVEDHRASLQALTHLLRQDGHQVVAAASLAEALAAAAVNPFDLLISDLGLPDGSGLELMEQLHATYGLRGVALTGYGMEEDLARTRAAGFSAHLVKPVAVAELRRVLAAVARPPT